MSSSKIFNLRSISEIRSLRIACILDEFSFECFRHECSFLQITPNNWEEELREFKPDLFFVESAWKGHEDSWKHKLLSQSKVLADIVTWCKDREIPTAFWNKEDPVSFELFTYKTGVSQLFDFVFTTDLDVINRYKNQLGHENIFLLPFTVQPSMHNPVEEFERVDGACFAGSYYRIYPKRSEDFKTIYDTILKYRDVTIYDRNFGRETPQFKFPDHYAPSIKGYLPFAEIAKGYKGYNYGITLNSVVTSQTMFARRALELIACNTSVISNYSRSLRLFFGENITMLSDKDDFEIKLQELFSNRYKRERTQGKLLRHVIKEFSAKKGLQLIVEGIIGNNLLEDGKSIGCLCYLKNPKRLANVLKNFTSQTHQNKKLFIITDLMVEETFQTSDISSFSIENFQNGAADSILNSHDLLVIFDENDYYGAQYLCDSVIAQEFSPGSITFRGSYYEQTNNKTLKLNSKTKPYHWSGEILINTSTFPRGSISATLLAEIITSQTKTCTLVKALSLDSLHYCFSACDLDDMSEVEVKEFSLPITSLREVCSISSGITTEVQNISERINFDSATLLKSFTQLREDVEVNLSSIPIRVSSSLPSGKHTYINSDRFIELDQITKDGFLEAFLGASYSCELLLFDIWFYDAKGKDVGRVTSFPNSFTRLVPPHEAKTVRFAFGVKGPGDAEISDFFLGTKIHFPSTIKNLASSLLVADSIKSAKVFLEMNKLQGVDLFVLTTDNDFEYCQVSASNTTIGGDYLFAALLKGSSYSSILFTNKVLQERICSNFQISSDDPRLKNEFES